MNDDYNNEPVELRPVRVEFESPRRKRFNAAHAYKVLRYSGALLISASMVVLGITAWEVIGSDITAGNNQAELAEQFEIVSNGGQATPVAAPTPQGAVQASESVIDDGTVSPGFSLSPEQVANFTDAEFGLNQRPGAAVVEAPSEAEATPEFERKEYGTIAGRIIAPSIDLDYYVTFGTDLSALEKGPGVWEYGEVPGNPGNATLAGHRTTYGGPFRHLDSLEIGDLIYFETPNRQTSVFEVRGSAVVLPENVSVTYPTDGVRLTLTTCTPVGSTRERLIIQAELVEGDFVDRALPASAWEFQGDL